MEGGTEAMRFEGKFSGHTTGGGVTAGAVVVLGIAVLGMIEAHAHAKQLGRGLAQGLEFAEIIVGSVAGLVVVAVLAGLVVYVRRNWTVTQAPRQPGMELEPASQGTRVWGLPVGHYSDGQPATYSGAEHRELTGRTGAGKYPAGQSLPATEVHQHLHFHGDDPVAMARQWQASQQDRD